MKCLLVLLLPSSFLKICDGSLGMRFDGVPRNEAEAYTVGVRYIIISITLNLIDVRWIDCTHDHLHSNVL